MDSKPSGRAVAAIAALVIFTVWINWRVKALEIRKGHQGRDVAMLHKTAPDFHLTSLDGRTVSLSDYRGKKKVVLSFWASWCGPCRMEAPVLREFYTKNAKAREQFELLGINMDDEREAAAKAAEDLKIPFPVLLDSQQKTAAAYEVYAIPTLMVIDKGGKVEFGTIGFNPAIEAMLTGYLNLPQTNEKGATR